MVLQRGRGPERLELERCSDHVKTTFRVLEDNAALKDVRAKIS